MGEQQVLFDAEVFSRTTSMFAAKRDAFPPGQVETLATDILRHLAQAKSHEVKFETPKISADSIAAFCETLIQPDPDVALRFIEERRVEGVTRQGVYLGYINAAARRLGEGWDTDQWSSLQVTYGTGHLYALMRAMRAEGPAARKSFDRRRCALFATVPGEDHGIGITVAADMFREVGWEIDLQIDTDHDILTRIIHQGARSARSAGGRPLNGDAAARDRRRLDRRPLGADRGAGRLRFRGSIGASAPLINRRGAGGVPVRGAGWPCRDRRSAGAA